MKDNLQLDKIKNSVESLVMEGVQEIMEFAKEKLEEKTPEDKRDLVQWYTILPIKKSGSIVTWTIVNKVPHWIYVEYGLSKDEGIPRGGKRFNYHKPKGTVFYRGVGARMVTRTYDQDQDEMFWILETKVNRKWL